MCKGTRCDKCGEITLSPTFIRGGDFCEDCIDFCVVCHTPRVLRDLSESGICVFCESEANREWQLRRLKQVKETL